MPNMPVESRALTAQDLMADFWGSDRPPQAMWDSWEDPQRTQVLTALACIPPFKSLYELGCGSGPNLRAIRRHRPQVTLGGSEPNVGLAAWASEHLNVAIDITGFPHAPGPEWDVALSCYALAYAPAEVAEQTLAHTRPRYLVLVEPCAWVEPYAAPGIYTHTAMPHHAHDYLPMLRRTGWSLTWRWPLYPHYQGLNTVCIAERL